MESCKCRGKGEECKFGVCLGGVFSYMLFVGDASLLLLMNSQGLSHLLHICRPLLFK